MVRSLRRFVIPALALTALQLAFACPARAQAQMAWVALDNAPAGTPAQFGFDVNASSPQASFFDLVIHGYWQETRMSPAGAPYSRVVFPGLPLASQPGQPFLPAVQVPIALPPGAAAALLGQVQVISHAVVVPPSPCWPTPIAEQDFPGNPEQFVAPDPAIYQGQSPWPATDGDARIFPQRRGPVMGGTFRLNPVHWNPLTNALDVMTHVRYQINHGTDASGTQMITRDAARFAGQSMLNWAVVGSFYPPDNSVWRGSYLIVTQPSNAVTLLPLILQKSARGYGVTIHYLTAAEIGNSDAIRAAIVNWYTAGTSVFDYYALLVGDVNVIPFGTHGTTGTDDLYGDADNDGTDDLDPEVFVGRLSVNDAADLANQVDKILRYEDTPTPLFDYSRDLLVANAQDAPGKYQGCLESVAGYGAYAIPPAFTKLYGSAPGNTNGVLSSSVNANYGLVTYRGHGDWDEWWNWNTVGETYYSGHVDALTNTVAPVVWSIACNTYDLRQSDCFAEHWMARAAPSGAVSFYGASEPSDTDPNHVLTRALHRAVFQYGYTKQARAIASAEKAMFDTTASLNSWRYGLLGDPDMDIRRETAYPVLVLKPAWLPPSAISAPVSFQVLGPDNVPLANALVGAYKPPGPVPAPAGAARLALPLAANGTLAAEFQDNHYTDATGNTTLNGVLPTSGWLYFAVRIDEGAGLGTAILDSIPVGSPVGVPFGGLGAGQFGAFPNVTRAGTEFLIGREPVSGGSIRVCDVMGRVVRTLPVARGARSVRWDGTAAAGTRVASGVYFARYLPSTSGDGTAAVARLAIVR